MSKAMRGIGIIKNLSKTLSWHSLVTIYKSFVRPHLDYGNKIYDQPKFFSENWNNSIQCCRCNYSGIKGTSQNKLYSKLGFESLKYRCWFRKLCTFLKIKAIGIAEYLFDTIPQTSHSYNTRLSEDVAAFHARTVF